MVRRKIKQNPNAVVVYARVSTEEQGKSGLGLEAQITACQRLLQVEGLECLGIFQEVTSGKVDPNEREQFPKALTLAIEQGASLLIAKLDRLSREVYHVSRYLHDPSHPRLILADRPNASEFEINIIASLAQEERRLISERTKAALAERRKQGMELGKAGREAHSQKAQLATQAALERAKALQDQGLSLKKIAETLNAEGLLTSRGTNWSKQAIAKRLT